MTCASRFQSGTAVFWATSLRFWATSFRGDLLPKSPLQSPSRVCSLLGVAAAVLRGEHAGNGSQQSTVRLPPANLGRSAAHCAVSLGQEQLPAPPLDTTLPKSAVRTCFAVCRCSKSICFCIPTSEMTRRLCMLCCRRACRSAWRGTDLPPPAHAVLFLHWRARRHMLDTDVSTHKTFSSAHKGCAAARPLACTQG